MAKCAKECGHGCSEEEYNSSVCAADKLVKRLGEGWRPEVWENLGWHFGALSPSGTVKVYPLGKGYHAFLGEAGEGGGLWVEQGNTPKAAVAAVVEVAREEISTMISWLDGF